MSAPLRPEVAPRSPRTRALAVLAVIFVVGALAGLALDRVVVAEAHEEAPVGLLPECARREGVPGDHPILRQLDLHLEQRARLDAILEERQAQITALWEEVQPRVAALMDSTHAEIDLILTPEQRATRDSIRALCAGPSPWGPLWERRDGGSYPDGHPQRDRPDGAL